MQQARLSESQKDLEKTFTHNNGKNSRKKGESEYKDIVNLIKKVEDHCTFSGSKSNEERDEDAINIGRVNDFVKPDKPKNEFEVEGKFTTEDNSPPRQGGLVEETEEELVEPTGEV